MTLIMLILILLLEFPYLFDEMDDKCPPCSRCCYYTERAMSVFKFAIVRGGMFIGFTAALFCTKDDLTRVGAVILGVSGLFYVISFMAGEDKHPERRSALAKKQFALIARARAAKAAGAEQAAMEGGLPSHPAIV